MRSRNRSSAADGSTPSCRSIPTKVMAVPPPGRSVTSRSTMASGTSIPRPGAARSAWNGPMAGSTTTPTTRAVRASPTS
jgi:hypothetical protein